MSDYTYPFTPGVTVSRAVTASTASVALGATGFPPSTVEIQSPSANAIAFIKFGDSTVIAAVTDYPIMPGIDKIVTPPPGTTHVASIGTTGTTLYFTSGHGA